MAKKREVTIFLDAGAYKKLEKRAKTNFLTVSELVSDIVRRSLIAMKRGNAQGGISDDKFIEYFSRRK